MNNVRNRVISANDLNKLIQTVVKRSIKVNDTSLYVNAFMHKSFLMNDGSSDDDCDCVIDFGDLPPDRSNERLEYLGDSVLGMITTEYIFDKFPNRQEGFMTDMRKKLVRDTQLAHLGYSLGFDKWFLISNRIERTGGRKNDKLIEDVFESFIGALYKDQGFQITRDFVRGCFDAFIDIKKLAQVNDNYKDCLQRFFQMNRWDTPRYTLVEEKREARNKKSFVVAVVAIQELFEDSIFYDALVESTGDIKARYNLRDEKCFYIQVASGNTKKIAEQNAAKKTLSMMNVPKNF